MLQYGSHSSSKTQSISQHLQAKLISIDQKRTEQFLIRNSHIEVQDIAPGVKEEDLSEAEINQIANPQIAAIAKK